MKLHFQPTSQSRNSSRPPVPSTPSCIRTNMTGSATYTAARCQRSPMNCTVLMMKKDVSIEYGALEMRNTAHLPPPPAHWP